MSETNQEASQAPDQQKRNPTMNTEDTRLVVPKKEIYTSYFGGLAALRASNIEPIAISRGLPKWFKGRKMQQLAPTYPMLKMSQADYDVSFAGILDRLDVESCWRAIPDKSALLCWEIPGERCHRRAVAEWLENHLQVTVTEFGFDRTQVPEYKNMPPKGTLSRKPANSKTKAERQKGRGQSFFGFM